MSDDRLAWYLARASAMSPREVGWRVQDRLRQTAERRIRAAGGGRPSMPPTARPVRRGPTPLPADPGVVPGAAAGELLRTADSLLDGRWWVLGHERTDLRSPDWFLDPTTGRRADATSYSFAVAYKDYQRHGNVKQVWELSRHHQLTVLSAAWWITRDERYATAVARQLRSWWAANPYLTGVHWTSGIEVGIRLISWVWVRRLLDGWPGAPGLFEADPAAVQQVWWHQRYLARFRSRGSSANNHAIAEAAGAAIAACGFDWYDESPRWREQSLRRLADELGRNTFPDGVNRELASDYQALVAELGLLASIEAAASGHPLPDRTQRLLVHMADAMAALLDCRLRPPRQGDGDSGRAWQVDGDATPHWSAALDVAAGRFGALPWWPARGGSVAGAITKAMGSPALAATIVGRPERRPDRFEAAGVHILRTDDPDGREVWLRCDGGPHGYLSIAAHAHADALSVELRHDGVDLLADPGTYCYHGEPEWRAFFRSTAGHNTVEIGGRDQAISGGPFLWRTHPATRWLRAEREPGHEQVWSAEHDGYRDLPAPARHRREVRLARGGAVTIRDEITSQADQALRLHWHLGPTVTADIDGNVARLRWEVSGEPRAAELSLPESLAWRSVTAATGPVAGWYSPSFGLRVPATTLVGTGTTGQRVTLVTRLRLVLPAAVEPRPAAAVAT